MDLLSGALPRSRGFHATSAVGGGVILLQGGVAAVGREQWGSAWRSESAPTPRRGQATTQPIGDVWRLRLLNERVAGVVCEGRDSVWPLVMRTATGLRGGKVGGGGCTGGAPMASASSSTPSMDCAAVLGNTPTMMAVRGAGGDGGWALKWLEEAT